MYCMHVCRCVGVIYVSAYACMCIYHGQTLLESVFLPLFGECVGLSKIIEGVLPDLLSMFDGSDQCESI